MKAMVLEQIGRPLVLREVPSPQAGSNEVEIDVLACAICRTDLHIIDGDLPHPTLPLILGHQIVGKISKTKGAFAKGDLVGASWLGKTCGSCPFCKSEEENLCDSPRFTGYTLQGGYAEKCVADVSFVFPLSTYDSVELITPLLCSGMIGYRCWKKVPHGKKIGFYGFGSAAHLLMQIALHEKKELFVFTRPGDLDGMKEARVRGAIWAGGSDETPPEFLDGAIVFAPEGALLPVALKGIRKGGIVVSADIHMSDIPSFPYSDLWGEKILTSVANLTRAEGREFLELARKISIKPEVTLFRLEEANLAIEALRKGTIQGSAVLIP